MWPTVVGSAVSGLMSGAASFFGQQQTNQMNMQMQQEQERYNTQMSNTAYQRASADMKAAGLNPMMMFGSGGPASSPTAPNVALKSPMQAADKSIADTANSVVSNAVQAKAIDKMTDEIANLQSTNLLIKEQQQTESVKPDIEQATVQNIAARTALAKAGLPQVLNDALTARNQMSIWDSVRKPADVAAFLGGRAAGALSPLTGLVSSAKGINSIVNPPWQP